MKARDDQEVDASKGPRNLAIVVAVISAAGVVLAALVTGVFGLLSSGSAPASSSPGTLSAAPHPVAAPSKSAGQPSPVPDSTARILVPRNGAVLHGNQSVLIEGTAKIPADSQLWIFIRRYGSYYVSDADPISIIDGRWQFLDAYVGNISNTGNFQISAVLANSSCTASIHSAKQQAGGGVAFPSMPRGCQTLDTIGVIRVGA